jgi:hypothetical protein
MKLDAHCAMKPGFDVELMKTAQELGQNVVQIPLQYNLHVFDWVCACGHVQYQGPTPEICEKCQKNVPTRVIRWKIRENKRTSGWYFDKNLHFQYWGVWGDRHAKEEIHDVMSCLGACWFVDREWYWSIDGLDEAHGSWGQMGTELACKAWLSGGRMVVNKRTWFAHMFRTQGGDFSFPYPLSGREVSRARKHSRKLWFDGTWPKAKYPLGWLLQKFAPFPAPSKNNPSWTTADVEPWLKQAEAFIPRAGQTAPAVAKPTKGVVEPTKGIVWYSDAHGRGDALFQRIVSASWAQVRRVAPGPIVAVVLGRQPLEESLHAKILRVDETRGYLTMFRQILLGLETLDTDIVYLCEHDVLYAPEHFEIDPVRRDRPTYNQSVWKVNAETGHALHYRCSQTSGLICDRQVLIDHYRRRIARVEQEGRYRPNMGFEPGTRQTRHGGIDDLEHDIVMTDVPNVDIRHGSNLTPSRWSKKEFRNQRFTSGWTEADGVPSWGSATRGRFTEWLAEVVPQ